LACVCDLFFGGLCFQQAALVFICVVRICDIAFLVVVDFGDIGDRIFGVVYLFGVV